MAKSVQSCLNHLTSLLTSSSCSIGETVAVVSAAPLVAAVSSLVAVAAVFDVEFG